MSKDRISISVKMKFMQNVAYFFLLLGKMWYLLNFKPWKGGLSICFLIFPDKKSDGEVNPQGTEKGIALYLQHFHKFQNCKAIIAIISTKEQNKAIYSGTEIAFKKFNHLISNIKFPVHSLTNSRKKRTE